MNQTSKKDWKSVNDMSFEECYSELQELVDKFEKGQMPLVESVDFFERGMELLKRCNQQLNEAESRVEKLLRRIDPDDMNSVGEAP
ncbi:MAG: exodeoxyribonuclease VII small subunit [bacterium]